MSSENFYFGYGSLVNRRTRPAEERFETTTVSGWQRTWAHRVAYPQAACVPLSADNRVLDTQSTLGARPPQGFSVLSVVPAKRVNIDGVLVRIALRDLPELDAREAGYFRTTVQSVKSTGPVTMYVSNSAHDAALPSDYPLLQSYVDCVLAGFLQVFGWSGVDRFIETTTGWDTPILADRSEPIYPRAVRLAESVAGQFDERIAAVQASYVEQE